MNPIETKLHDIAKTLFRDMEAGKLAHHDLGLISGSTGILIFCKQYLRYYPDKEQEAILNTYLDLLFERLVSGVELFTYCSGLAGVLEGLKYLNKEKLVDVDYSDIEESYKYYLQKFSIQNILDQNYDYLHGGLGIVKYFSEDPFFVNQALDALEEVAIKDGNNYTWISRIGMEGKSGHNISLSHGISSIVSVISSLPHSEIYLEKRDRLLNGACGYIMSQQIDSQKYGCCFPTMSLENESPVELQTSRLAWCYGDLGVATGLWQAGRTLQNQCWMDKAVEVFTHSARRRTQADSMVMDAGLCHGAAGISMMFEYMYRQTKNQLFRETRNFWVNQTLNLGHFEDGLAGYKAWQGHDLSWVKSYTVLEGIAGVGLLLLMSQIESEQGSDWMNFFMLN